MASDRAARRRSAAFKAKNPKWRQLSDPGDRTDQHVDPALLKPYARNARTHSKKQLRQIASSIKRFGFNNPMIVDGER